MADDRLVALAERLQGLSIGRGVTVAIAESCTGGLVAEAITDVAGSSGYFLGGIVAYADRIKATQLGVPVAVLEAHGAVSAQVARGMALGARERFGADVSVAVTGIAGPGGGSDEKPVGLTYVAVADEAGVDVQRHHWQGDRQTVKRSSAAAALEMLIERVARDPRGTAGE
jgi:PncC family amidohydrolase